MWELKHEPACEGVDEYWILTKEGKCYGAFFNKVLADRILAFLSSKWIGKPKVL